jgi:tetratricopeptide (TPR) repeat protein
MAARTRSAIADAPAVRGADEATKDADLARAGGLLARGRAVLDGPLGPSRAVKFTAAARHFQSAADAYAARARWRQAADAYAAAAEVVARTGEPHAPAVAATHWEAAAAALAHVDVPAALPHYRRAVELLASPAVGAPASAGGLALHLAELLLRDGALEAAADAFVVAAEHYLGDNGGSGGGGGATGAALHLPTVCRALHGGGVAYARAGDFEAAHAAFDRCATFAREHNLLKARSPDLVLQAGLCVLAAGDLPGLAAYTAQAAADDPVGFAVGRERRFLADAAESCAAYDRDGFADHAWNFDYVRPWAPWELRCVRACAGGWVGGWVGATLPR